MAEAQVPQNVPQANVMEFLQGAAAEIQPGPNAGQNAVQAVPQPDIGPVVCCFCFANCLFSFFLVYLTMQFQSFTIKSSFLSGSGAAPLFFLFSYQKV